MTGKRPWRHARSVARGLTLLALVLGAGATLACTPTPSGAPAAPSPGAAPATAPPALLPLRLGLAFAPVSAIPTSVLWLAKDLGYYEREGLDTALLEMPGTPTVVSALLSDEIDVGNVATEDVIRLTATGTVDLRAIDSPDSRLHFVVAARDTVGSLADLRGKPFGIARPGDLGQTMTALVLRGHGVNPAEVSFVNIGPPAGRAQALVGGQIDATAFSIASFKAIAREPGVKLLVGVDEYFAAAPFVQKVMRPLAARSASAPSNCGASPPRSSS